MIGRYEVIVKNARLQYKFVIERNITILRGDSATGKTTLIDMIAAYQQNGEDSGVTVSCKKKCVVLTSLNWEVNLSQIQDSIVFIDEGSKFVASKEFAAAIKESDNFYVIATRTSLFALPYSVQEIYGIKNKSGNRYQKTKRLYSEFYLIHKTDIEYIEKPECVVVEDSHSGYEFFEKVCTEHGIECISAGGKSNIFHVLKNLTASNVLLIADGAAFGPELESVLEVKRIKNLTIYLPESFEWIVLQSGLVPGISSILEKPYEYIDSKKYFSWEQFFNSLLTEETKGSYLQYSKRKLNPVYLRMKEKEKIVEVIPKIEWK